jgi:hypothetical protein
MLLPSAAASIDGSSAFAIAGFLRGAVVPAVDASGPPAAPLVFPHVLHGTGVETYLFLVNTSTVPSLLTVESR